MPDCNAPLRAGVLSGLLRAAEAATVCREPSFGHAILELHNATRATFTWHRNQDLAGMGPADRVVIKRDPACYNQRIA